MGVAHVVLALEESEGPAELVRTLRDAGMESDVTAGAETIARLAAGPCDVLVGPALAHGRGIFREARNRFPDLEIVAVLPAEAAAQGPACLREGAGDLVLSPVVADELLDAVWRALDRRRARDLAREHLSLVREAALGQLSAAVAHDLSNPVSVLLSAYGAMAQEIEKLGKIELLLGNGAAGAHGWWQVSGRAALQEALAIAADAAAATQRLNVLARDLQTVSRFDPARVALVEVVAVVEMVLRMVRSIVSPHATLETYVPGRLHAWANTGALALALSQLLVRGTQPAVPPAAREKVRVRATAAGPRVLIDIEEPGLPLDEGAVRMAIARDLVEAQGGTLSTEPGPAGGTVFRIVLRGCAV